MAILLISVEMSKDKELLELLKLNGYGYTVTKELDKDDWLLVMDKKGETDEENFKT